MEKSDVKDFNKIIKDFINDVLSTFPEIEPLLSIESQHIKEEGTDADYAVLHQYIKEKYPSYFFDILYQNEELFEKEVMLLPNIDFSLLWKDNISDKTRGIIWKYLQLLVVCVIYDTDDKDAFGDMSEVFKSINQEELKDKLNDIFGNMNEFFDHKPNADMNPDTFQEHLNGLLGGKLGALAKEIVDETTDDLKNTLDLNENMDGKEVLNKLMQNPKKIMGLANTINSKIETKLKNGEIKQSELLEEAQEMMKKMKNIPGMDKIEDLMKKFGGKMDMKGMQNNMKQHLSQAKMRERMQEKLKQRNEVHETKEQKSASYMDKNIDELYESIFSTGEVVEKSKKKGKKGKNKK